MAGAAKGSPSTPNGARPKKAAKSLIIALKLSPHLLSTFPNAIPSVKVEEPIVSSSTNTVERTSTSSPAELPSDSNANTPAPSGNEDAIAMPPPAVDGPKKKGPGKRKSAAEDGLLKPRGKPGPKKKQKLEDGSLDPNSLKALGMHRLGPKANMGAINAGLRALDRTGAPCRKWQKTSFVIKSFTGNTWEIPRWRAPPKISLNGQSTQSSAGDSSSGKENASRDGSNVNGADSQKDAVSEGGVPASSPAPVVSAAA